MPSTPWHSRIGYVAMLKNLKLGFDCQWRTTFCAIAWKILVWSGGVELFFYGDLILPHDPNRRIAHDVEIAVSAFYSKKTEPSMKVSKLIAWEFPYIGRFKFNTDGAFKRNQDLHGAVTGHSGKSGAGGLLRDSSGTWICGYTC